MQTGEDIQSLRKISDMTRLFSLLILVIHFYLFGYIAFQQWHLTWPLTDRLLSGLAKMSLFKSILLTKVSILGLLIISMIGTRGKKDEKINWQTITAYLTTGLLFYGLGYLCLYLQTSV